MATGSGAGRMRKAQLQESGSAEPDEPRYTGMVAYERGEGKKKTTDIYDTYRDNGGKAAGEKSNWEYKQGEKPKTRSRT